MNQRILAAIEKRATTEDMNVDALRLFHLYYNLRIALAAPGAILEIGCNKGYTSAVIAVILEELGHETREFAVYDSFAGLPELSQEDAGTAHYLKPGHLAAKPDDVIANCRAYGTRIVPRIVPGWFDATLHPKNPIAFALLDGDFYESILVSLERCYPLMSPGAVIVIDDYSMPDIPGCKRACDLFFRDKKEKVETLAGGCQAVVHFARCSQFPGYCDR